MKEERGKEWPALSVRQPWAWLIVEGFKDIENRTWRTSFCGWVWIHAGKTMTRADYEACEIFTHGISNIELPSFEELKERCGGIVGRAFLKGCVSESDSPWFVGDYGFQLYFAEPTPFVPCKGALGFFRLLEDVRRELTTANAKRRDPEQTQKPDDATNGGDARDCRRLRVSDSQLRKMEHALGNKTHYRNRYIVHPESDDFPELIDLTVRGLMRNLPQAPPMDGGLLIFEVTEAGKELCFA